MGPVRTLFSVLVLSGAAVCQLPSSACDRGAASLAECPFVTPRRVSWTFSASGRQLSATARSGETNLAEDQSNGGGSSVFISSGTRYRHENFHWKRALFESFMLLSIEQAYVVKDDFRWVVQENGVPFNHYWRDYNDSLSTWAHSGWDDGDPLLYSYVGHPVQGAFTEYIQIQNDPQGRNLEFSNSKAYWWSRFKAFWWNAAYSTQWNIGPLSEMTVEKYGTIHYTRWPWTHKGTWPCYQHCVSGVGQVDLVTTPVGGTLWLVTEDLLDKKINEPLEGATRNRFLIDLTRCALNPVRSGANMLHGKRPWYRASRDARALYFDKHPLLPSVRSSPKTSGMR